MRICIIVDDYMPDSIKVGAKMMHELAREFKKENHTVTVITPSEFLTKNMEITLFDGIQVCKFKSGRIKNTGKIRRTINETLLSYRAWYSLKKYFQDNEHDYIIYYSPTIFWGPLVKKLKKLWNVKSYLILRDIFPQWAIDQELIKEGSLIEKYFKVFEKYNYKVADTIGLMSDKNLEWFKEKESNEKKLEVLYNWAENISIESTNYYRKKYNLEDKIVFFYGGNMGYAQDMMNIIRLAINMKTIENVYFFFVGAGDEVELIKNVIKRQELKNIILLPSVSQKEYIEMLVEFDVGLFSLHSSHVTHNFPGKLLGYMVHEIPILGSINSGNDLKRIFDEEDAGYISINGEDDIFLENAKKLLNPEERRKLAKNAKQLLLKKFSVKSASKKILEHC